jgi:hypothetical protein
MKKNILVICLLVTQLISLSAQEDSAEKAERMRYAKVMRDSNMVQQLRQKALERESAIKDADFIFEGIASTEEFYTRVGANGKEQRMRSSIVTVTKVFRGNLKLGTVEVLDEIEDWDISAKRVIVNLHRSLTRGIYFCKVNKVYPFDSKYNIYAVDNKSILASCGFINLFVPGQWFDKKFESKGRIYRYISTLPNITMPVISKEDTVFSDQPVQPKVFHGHTKAYVDSVNRENELKINQQP